MKVFPVLFVVLYLEVSDNPTIAQRGIKLTDLFVPFSWKSHKLKLHFNSCVLRNDARGGAVG
jgi:hypothetical protein